MGILSLKKKGPRPHSRKNIFVKKRREKKRKKEEEEKLKKQNSFVIKNEALDEDYSIFMTAIKSEQCLNLNSDSLIFDFPEFTFVDVKQKSEEYKKINDIHIKEEIEIKTELSDTDNFYDEIIEETIEIPVIVDSKNSSFFE